VYGGANGWGTIFKITSSGALTTLYNFTHGADGAYANGLVMGKDGNLYGTTGYGGANSNNGTVFKINTSGTLTTLYSFTGGADGANPYAGLIQGKDGNLYGTTQHGGLFGNGTVFKLTMPPVVHSFFQAEGPVGTFVNLTGNNFTETTRVLVGTISAYFTIISDTSLTFWVPSGAVTSKITVINPFGKGSNPSPFTVTP